MSVQARTFRDRFGVTHEGNPIATNVATGVVSGQMSAVTLMTGYIARYARIDRNVARSLDRLPMQFRTFAAREAIDLKSGDNLVLVVEGLIARSRTLRSGALQITALHIPGDLISVSNARRTDAAVQHTALTDTEVRIVSKLGLLDIGLKYPEINAALLRAQSVATDRFEHWIVNIGRRNATQRLAYLLLEMAARYSAVGRFGGKRLHLPMTQEKIGDVLALTAIHVNRCLKALRGKGFVTVDNRTITFSDLPGLRRFAECEDHCFDDLENPAECFDGEQHAEEN